MASSEGATDVSTEERFERKKDELLELIEKLAKRLGVDDEHGAATTAIDGRDLGAGSTSGHRDPYIGLLEDELAASIRQYDMLAAQLDSDDGHGAATTSINGRNLGAGSTFPVVPDDGHSAYITRINERRPEARDELIDLIIQLLQRIDDNDNIISFYNTFLMLKKCAEVGSHSIILSIHRWFSG